MEIPKPIYASVDLGRDGKPLSNKPSSSSSSSSSHDEKEGGGSRKKQQHNNKKSNKSSTLTDSSNNKKTTRKPIKLWTPGDLLVSNTNNVVQEKEEEEEEEENTENTHIKKSGKKSGKKPSSSITPRLIFKKEKDTDNWISSSSSSIENIKNSQKPASDLESDENDDMFDENDDDIILISAKEKEESIHQRQEVKKREAANQAEVRELLKDMDEVDPVRRRLQDALKITASGRLKDTQEFKKKINSLNKIVEKQGKTISTLKQSLSLARKEIGYLTSLLDQANSQLQIYVPNESNNWGLNIPQQHHHQSQSAVPKRMTLQQQQPWIKSKSEPVHEVTPDIAAKSGTWIPGKGWSRPHQNSNNEKSMNDIPDGLMDSLMETLES